MNDDTDAMDIDTHPQQQEQQHESGSSAAFAAMPLDQQPLIMLSHSSTTDNSVTAASNNKPPQHSDSIVSVSSSAAAGGTNLSASSHNNNNNNNPHNPPRRSNTRNSMTSVSSSDDCVKVAVRIRPLLPLERQEPCLTILDEPMATSDDESSDEVATSVQVGGRRTGVTYTFDCVHGATTSQARLYYHSVVPLLHACLEGYNATILAYGQTGSGKTHTILGNHVTELGESQGVLPRTLHALFDALSSSQSEPNDEDVDDDNDANKENPLQPQQSTEQDDPPASPKRNTPDRPCDDWRVQVQFLEIYGEDIRDLLVRPGEDGGVVSHRMNSSSNINNKVTIRDGVGPGEEPEVLGVHQPRVESAAEALQILQTGRLRRVTAATAMNATSSRSHALFTIMVEQEWKTSTPGAAASGAAAGGGSGSSIIRRSKFHFVDLAGSERAKRTQAVGQRLKEGIEINKGLLVLGNVIAALASSSKANKPIFVPYRDSKLTRLLRGSLGGNHKTLMIACVSPSADNLEESLNCLRYANRAKQIQNKATINLDPTSQYILTLQQHITKLAQLALNPTSDSVDGAPYTREQLQALAGGEAVETVMAGAHPMDTGGGVSATTASQNQLLTTVAAPQEVPAHRHSMPTSVKTPSRPTRPVATSTTSTVDLKDSAEEGLYWQKAQNSMHQVFRHRSPTKEDGTTPSIAITPSMDSQDSAVMDLTAQKMMEYEREIGELKKALAVERSQRAMIQEEQSWMDEVQQSLQEDRHRLEQLQSTAVYPEKYDEDEESSLNRIEAEQDAEQKALRNWTKKYTKGQGLEDGNEGDVEDNDDDSAESNPVPSSQSADALGMLPPSKHRDIQEDLMELARSIAAKEELIGQLKASQQRYEEMREFYESKLKEMEHSLLEKEEERETLVKKLEQAQKVKAGGVRSQELKEKLREKEAHIAVLKKKSVELRNLTTVSSRNANEIARLTRDVESMKRRKVDLQKQLAVERRNHASQIKQMQKEAMQKERELTKYKRLTSKKEIEAEKANQIAKSRLAELGVLRQKYKDTEKKLRVASVKRGVMAKAGLDPVLVGHRDKGKHNIDTNALRDLFDEKVSKVARKEALVNKLAEEWEQHFQLSSKRNEVAKNESPEDLENIELQLKYKEDRIRNLAKRLEKEGPAEEVRDTGRTDNKESFLFDAQFERVCKAAPPEVAHKSLAKVLFGMVVRERRRVAALARTACSLDERLQSTAEDLEAKDLALRSQIDEQRVQVAEMSQNQQNQILSLMELVKEDANVPRATSNGEFSASTHQGSGDFDETLLVLANERITLLEKQLETSEREAESSKNYRLEMEETMESLKKSQEESRFFEEELQKANADMRNVKELLLKLSNRGVDLSRVVTVVNRALGEEFRDGQGEGALKHNEAGSFSARKPSPIPSAIKEAIHFDEESELEEEIGKPEPLWANEIMEDLALIAEGKVPPSLKGTPGFDERHEPDTVFERLADPENYTGTQKQVQLRNKSRPRGRAPTRTPSFSDSAKSGREGSAFAPRDSMQKRPSAKNVERDAMSKERQPSSARSRSRAGSRVQSSFPRDAKSSVGRLQTTSKPRGTQLLRRDENASKAPGLQRQPHPANNDHGEENVFERLSNQTTFAFSIRQNGVPDEGGDQHPPRASSVDAMLDEVLGTTPYHGHSSPDVFERLTKTTTEAYAMKRKNEA